MSLVRQQQDFGMVRCRLADQTYEAPDVPGLYGWYYTPTFSNEAEFTKQIAALCISAGPIEGRVTIDYGVSLRYESIAQPRYSDESEHVLIREALKSHLPAVRNAFENFLVPFFTRPIYIGMAKNLRSRLYTDHYKALVECWEPTHPVSGFLAGYTGTENCRVLVDTLMTEFSLSHSFALEARVRGFSPRDLRAFFIETSDFEPATKAGLTEEQERATRRTVERLFQLISLPICGRI
ncbi:MAG: hypothetical protein R3B09_02410 [Nannocystaceae bacterium]